MAPPFDPLFTCFETAIASNLANLLTWHRDAERCLAELRAAPDRFPARLVGSCVERLKSALSVPGVPRRRAVLEALESSLRALDRP